MITTQNEIVLYQPDTSLALEVRLEDETVWLTQNQMADLFQTTRNNVSMHISNIFKEGELEKPLVSKDFLHTTQHGALVGKFQQKYLKIFNLDVIISVGYRIKSQRGTQFRIWANSVLKEYLLKGYAIDYRINRIEKLAIETEYRVTETEKKIDFFVKTSLPPQEGIFFNGQILDAYVFVSDLIKSAKQFYLFAPVSNSIGLRGFSSSFLYAIYSSNRSKIASNFISFLSNFALVSRIKLSNSCFSSE